MSGKLIVFEGADGCGKSTAILGLALDIAFGRTEHRRMHDTREPYYLQSHDLGAWQTPYQRAAAYALDRGRHLAEVILPRLARGYVVICDRGPLSNIVALAAVNGSPVLGFALDAAQHDLRALESPWPVTLTVILGARPDVLDARIAARAARGEASESDLDAPLQARLRDLYRAAQPHHCGGGAVVHVDTSGDREATAAAVLAAVRGVL